MVRLLALDLDQTLFGSDLIVSPRVNDAVARALKSRVLVTIATGREARLATRFATELKLTAPIICAQGGCTYDHLNNRVLHEVRLLRDMLPRILHAAHQYGWNITVIRLKDVEDQLVGRIECFVLRYGLRNQCGQRHFFEYVHA
jgi:hydroxymethylpyrimidine pyrophosphatase-like HAD family hydrolase